MKSPPMHNCVELKSSRIMSLGALALLFSLSWSATSTATDSRASKPAQPVMRDAADDWFDKGSAAYDAHKVKEAEAAFQEAWKLKKAPDIAANLGQVEAELGKHREAAAFFSYAVKNAAPTDSQEARRDVKQRLDDALKLVAVLRIVVNVPGASVLMDGEVIGKSPLREEVFAEPGTVTIEAKLQGYADARSVVRVSKESSKDVRLELMVATNPSEGPNKTLLIAGGASAGIALGAGVVLAVLSSGKASDAASKGGWEPCYGATAPVPNRCPELDGLRRDSATLANVSLWSFVGAGAIGVTTLVYALIPHKKAAPTTGFRIDPVPMTRGGGIAVGGQW